MNIPISFINFGSYLKGTAPTPIQVGCTIFFLLLWLIWAGNESYRRCGKPTFLRFSTLYWLTALLLTFIGYMSEELLLGIPVMMIFLGPLYGLRIFLPELAYDHFAYVSLFIAYAMSMAGYLLGIFLRNYLPKQKAN
ncbi:hypothetical protein JCM10914_1653 [Paenibacillus sp. JCM 10914]|nr:hypothetical protein JCM10914_1653 [Paenibacillus sp. JCM 10914]